MSKPKKPSSIIVTSEGVTKLMTKEESTKALEEYVRLSQLDEPLCEELQGCVQRGGMIPMIQHPLVHAPLSFPGVHNRCLTEKRSLLDRLAKERDLCAMSVIVEKPYRIRWLFNIVMGRSYYDIPVFKVNIRSAEFFETLTYAWTSSENLWQDTPNVQALLGLHPTGDKLWRLAMDKDELEVWDKLPEKIEVYRGCENRNRRGFSWTLDRERARWFSTRFFSTSPQVLHGVVNKADCYFYMDGRSESEIVVCPSKVKILSVHKPEPHRKKSRGHYHD